MVSKDKESPSSALMTEGLLTSSFGSHESVCKPVQPELEQVRGMREVQGGKVEMIRRNMCKVLLDLFIGVIFLVIVFLQVIGTFSLHENIFYGAIFLTMTIIVLSCFFFVNRTSHSSAFHRQALYDMGKGML